MAAITHTNINNIYSTNSTNTTNVTYSSWDNRKKAYLITYRGTTHSPVKEIKSKWHAFCFLLNKILDPPEEILRPPEKPPPKKPKVILYVNVKLARAPPLVFFFC